MGKTIFLINQYASTPETGMGGRHHYLARELGKLGHNVYLIAARWHHLLNDEAAAAAAPHIEERDHYTFARVPTMHYPNPHHPKRVGSWLRFMSSIRVLDKRLGAKPDTIFYSSPSLPGYLGAERLANRVGARLIFEERDIWPLTLVEVGGKSPNHPFIRWLQWIEDRAYRNAEFVVSNLPNAVDHMQMRGMDPKKFHWAPNGVSFEETDAPVPLSRAILNDIEYDKFRIGYTGTVGKANMVGVLVDAAEKLRDLSDLQFLIFGTGSEIDTLRKRIDQKGLTNVKLMGSIPKKQVQSALAILDVCYIGLVPEKLFRFGVSPNKLFEYMIAGRPIIYGIDSGAYQPIASIDAGLEIAPGDSNALAEAIRKLRDLPDETLKSMGARAHAFASEHHDYEKIAKKLEKLI